MGAEEMLTKLGGKCATPWKNSCWTSMRWNEAKEGIIEEEGSRCNCSLCAMKALLFMMTVLCSLSPCAADTRPVNKVQLLPALELQIKNREFWCKDHFMRSFLHAARSSPRTSHAPRPHTRNKRMT